MKLRNVDYAMIVRQKIALVQANVKIATRDLEAYFGGRRAPMRTPADLRLVGTPFARAVLEVTRTIPYGELWTYGDVTMRLRDRDSVRLRADLYWWLDARASTQTRSPNPELWLWLEYEASF